MFAESYTYKIICFGYKVTNSSSYIHQKLTMTKLQVQTVLL